MKTLNSFAEMALTLVEREAAMAEALHEGLKRVAERVEKTARSELGVYQPAVGAFPAWPELAESTKADRAAKGFTENDPLLRSGELRDSIEDKVEGLEALIGTERPEAAYLEFGTSKMPARPFMGPAGFRSRDTIQKLVGAAAMAGLIGGEQVHQALGYDLETAD